MKFEEFDCVKNTRNIGTVPKGAKGTILDVYDEGLYYHVEFVDEEYEHIGLEVVHKDDLILIKAYKDIVFV